MHMCSWNNTTYIHVHSTCYVRSRKERKVTQTNKTFNPKTRQTGHSTQDIDLTNHTKIGQTLHHTNKTCNTQNETCNTRNYRPNNQSWKKACAEQTRQMADSCFGLLGPISTVYAWLLCNGLDLYTLGRPE